MIDEPAGDQFRNPMSGALSLSSGARSMMHGDDDDHVHDDIVDHLDVIG